MKKVYRVFFSGGSEAKFPIASARSGIALKKQGNRLHSLDPEFSCVSGAKLTLTFAQSVFFCTIHYAHGNSEMILDTSSLILSRGGEERNRRGVGASRVFYSVVPLSEIDP